MPRFNEQNHGQTVEADFGQEVEIYLQENPTTGFRWQVVQTGEPICTLVSETFDPGRKAPGQAGIHSWKFKVVAEGTASIELVYRRSWDTATAAGHTFTLCLSGRKQRAAKSDTS
jgi:inhibitor of cysteine peptidase